MSENAAAWDALTREALREAGNVKWAFTAPDEPVDADILAAWVAEMDYGTSPSVLEAWQESAKHLEFGYPAPSLATDMARATADWYAENYGWAVDPADIFPLADVIKGLELAISEFSKPGAAVIVPTPAYMPFLSVPETYGRTVIQVPMIMDADGAFTLDLATIGAHLADGANLVILANPGNPTGKVYSRDELVALADMVDSHGGRVFSDEIHAPLVLFGHRHVPLASVSESGARVAITATSASKAWNLPGLKCAQIILSNDSDRARWTEIGFMASHGASTPGLRANTAAFAGGGAWLGEVIAYLENNHGILESSLAELLPEAKLTPLQGTYLTWIDLSAYPVDDEISKFLLNNALVRVNGGGAFGTGSENFIRLNIATSGALLREIVERIARALTTSTSSTNQY
jgi:cystathionine beta-lyase